MFFYFKPMATVTIDGKEYDTEQLSDGAKDQLGSLKFVQNEIAKLNAQLAVYKTAASSYSAALKQKLDE